MKNIKNTDILKLLENNGIDYTVLRGYIPIEEINKSLDVDIYIPYVHRKKVHQLFKSWGWYSQKINCSRYPHKQYIYISDGKINKIDVVYGLYYGNDLGHFTYEDKALENTRKIEGINALNIVFTLITFILHIIYDKNNLSEKNQRYMKLMYDEYKNTKEKQTKNIPEKLCKIFIDIAKDMAELNIDEINKKIMNYKKIINDEKVLNFNKLKTITYKFKQKINNIIRYSWLKLSRKSLTIIGVDGSGKSTTTENIKTILGDKAVVEYMGFKDYKLNFVKKHFENPKAGNLYNLKSTIYSYIDMWYRYLKNRFSNNVIIYDRFPWEASINNKGIAKLIYYIEFRIFFPRPKYVYYLHCKAETSLNRKNDIEDAEKFKLMKDNFDKEYLNKKKVRAFSTDDYTNEEIVREIVKDLNNKMLKYLM